MKTNAFGLLFLTASMALCRQADKVCSGEFCQSLEVEDGVVRLVTSVPGLQNRVVGTYISAAQDLVPSTEAPISELKSAHGWRLVVNAYLDHSQDEVRLRLRCIAPNGSLSATQDLLSALDDFQVGDLFGGSDEILVVTSEEEHAYNAKTDIWYLPITGRPKSLLSAFGTVEKLSKSSDPGVTVERETYDGIHAETKGRVPEFWAWDPTAKTLTLHGR